MNNRIKDQFQIKIEFADDVLLARNLTKQMIQEINFSKFEEQQILVFVSELTNNIVKHAGVKGLFTCIAYDAEIHIIVEDKGRGIADVSEIFKGNKQPVTEGLGLGLKGIKNLMDEFFIETKQNQGVKIIAIKEKK